LLEYVPDALIPFRQARVLQRTSFSLDPGATLFCWDTIAPGRAASGELFQYECLKIVSEIQALGVPILTDRLLIEPKRWPVRAAARFGEANYLVTFVAMRAGMSAKEVSALEERLLAVISSAETGSFWGVSSLPAHGVLVRGMVSESVRIPATLHALWSAAKQQICDRAAVAPRKTY
jgi:urease accessory protein